jgi:hypothetical protein
MSNELPTTDRRLLIRVFQLRYYRAGGVGAKRRIETKFVTGERRSLGFDRPSATQPAFAN